MLIIFFLFFLKSFLISTRQNDTKHTNILNFSKTKKLNFLGTRFPNGVFVFYKNQGVSLVFLLTFLFSHIFFSIQSFSLNTHAFFSKFFNPISNGRNFSFNYFTLMVHLIFTWPHIFTVIFYKFLFNFLNFLKLQLIIIRLLW